MRTTSTLTTIALVLATLSLAACGGQQPEEDEPRVLDYATLEAILTATAAAEVAAPAPASPPAESQAEPANPPAPTPTPAQQTGQVVPTPTIAPSDGKPVRITFDPGAISSSQEGQLAANDSDLYDIYALGSQVMFVSLTASGDFSLSVTTAGAQPVPATRTDSRSWVGRLPATQNYTLTVASGDSSGNYLLLVTILPLETDDDCVITATAPLTAYLDPSTEADVFGSLAPADQVHGQVQTADGWFGFDPGIAQAGNTGLARLRWIKPGDGQVLFSDACVELELVHPQG